MESLLKKAKELEKKYEWLQATEFYKKAADLASEERDWLKAAELLEQKGFCFYKGALQAQTIIDFRKRLKQSITAYKTECKLLEETKEGNNQPRYRHVNALIAYVQSWLEKRPSKKKKLLNEWWTLENQVLSEYERIGNDYYVGKKCNDLLEYSFYDRYWLQSDYSEFLKMSNELLSLAEKAVQTLSKLDDRYELARAYCFAAWYNSWGIFVFPSPDRIKELNEKCQSFLEKAIKLCLETGDAELISKSNISAIHAIQLCKFDPTSALEYGVKAIKYGAITRDNFLIGYGNCLASISVSTLSPLLEDPDKQKESFEKAKKMGQEAIYRFNLINYVPGHAYSWLGYVINRLASIETDQQKRHNLLRMATDVIKKGLKRSRGWKRLTGPLYDSLSENLYLVSQTRSELEEKRKLLQKAQTYAKKFVNHQERMTALGPMRAFSYSQLALLHYELARIEKNDSEKVKLLRSAIKSIKKCSALGKKAKRLRHPSEAGYYLQGRHHNLIGKILKQFYSLTKDEKVNQKAVLAYEAASMAFKEAKLPTHMAESYWHISQLNDELGEHQEASQNYELSAEAYDLAAKKIPQLKQFYEDYASYMRAWSQIEQARYSHSIEEYEKAHQHYERAAELHEMSRPWSYLSPNYFAWANMEEAESLSRKENAQLAKQTFQKALKQFTIAEKSIEQKIEEITSADEKEMILRLFKASNLRRKYCEARILMEDAKILDRVGNYLQSSKSYGEAARNISAMVEEVDVEAERNELKYMKILCEAWGKMASAEETASSESYLEAAALFEQAKEHCFTQKASFWALGNSSFCKGLAAKNKFQSTFDKSYHVMANKHVKQAADYYKRAGFRAASEYAKATQRLFDANVYMNSAEEEVNPEKKTKYYQLAEQLLQLSAGLFVKAKQPEKTAQVKEILATVREEKALASSLSQVMQAPTITSSTLSFTAPTPTKETSVGLESFEHANVQANLIAAAKEVKVGESFCLSIEFVNAGKEPALLTRVEEFIPRDFIVVKKPEIYRLEENCLNMKGKQLAPLKLVEAKLVLQPSKKGVYQLKPKVNYLDELGQRRFLELESLEIRVEELILADRVSTGTKELDSLLLGGIPEEYAVVLTGSPSDEREMIIKNFLEAGIKEGQITFYITPELTVLKDQLRKYQSTYYLFLCNPKPKVEVPDLPNVYQLRGPTDLTNLSIALTKAYRNMKQTAKKKRVCVEIVSEVLVNYGTITTRKWISELITDLGSKGFTMLAVMNPVMHPLDKATAVLDLFDGEISIVKTKDTLECKTSVQIEKLKNQDYIRNPICLRSK